jgi:predicted DNA-binding protein
MPRASEAQRITRLNLAFHWLRQGLTPPEVTERLTAEAGISHRQAHRYVEEAQELNSPLPAADTKVVFTVKLPQALVQRLHQYAESTGQTLSQIVSQALWALFRRGGRG